ncbi:MAG: hypothetical protein KKF89_06355 [Nanoarchaeota archaeon]|nr:hypothetical protein [Nanoarchaeota archaeon]MBU1855320.1 hypothetical protein [Nanoarchaeota archaeon]
MKKHMTKDQEFEIMKLVLDKFLWIGIVMMAFGFYKLISLSADFWYGFSVLIGGAIVMFLFTWLLVKEYHFMK